MKIHNGTCIFLGNCDKYTPSLVLKIRNIYKILKTHYSRFLVCSENLFGKLCLSIGLLLRNKDKNIKLGIVNTNLIFEYNFFDYKLYKNTLKLDIIEYEDLKFKLSCNRVEFYKRMIDISNVVIVFFNNGLNESEIKQALEYATSKNKKIVNLADF